MNRSLDRNNKKTITKSYHMKKTHFHAPGRMKQEAKRRQKELIERTKARLKEEAWEESVKEPVKLVPGGEVLRLGGEGLGTVVGYLPEKELLLAVGHAVESRVGSAVRLVAVQYDAEKQELREDWTRRGTVKKLWGTVGATNEYGALIRYRTDADHEESDKLALAMATAGKAVIRNEALPGGEAEITLRIIGGGQGFAFRLQSGAKGMSGSPIIQEGRLVGCLIAGDERGNMQGIQIMNVVGSLLTEADSIDWSEVEANSWEVAAETAADMNAKAVREAMEKLGVAADQLEKTVSQVRATVLAEVKEVHKGIRKGEDRHDTARESDPSRQG